MQYYNNLGFLSAGDHVEITLSAGANVPNEAKANLKKIYRNLISFL
jgi:hypothetical protein